MISLVSLLGCIQVNIMCYNFINSMIEDSKYGGNVVKEHFIKKLLMTKEEDDEHFENSSKCCVFDDAQVDGDEKNIFFVTVYNVLVQQEY